MRNREYLGSILAIGLAACGGTSGTDGGMTGTDSGQQGQDGGGGGTDGGPVTQPVLMAWNGTAAVPADLSCVGSATAPTAGAATDFPLRAVSRGLTDAPLPNAVVQIFPDNVLPQAADSCSGSCVEIMVGAAGTSADPVNLPANGWISYRVLADTTAGNVLTQQVNKVTAASAFNDTASDALEVSAINGALFSGGLSAGEVMRQAGTATVTGTAFDCTRDDPNFPEGRPLIGAVARVFMATTEIQAGSVPTGPKVVYWPNTGPLPRPNRDQSSTSQQGRYASANLPAGSMLRVEIWGVQTDGAQPTRVGCEEFPAVADSVTLLFVGPTRSDGPTACR